MKRVSAAGWGPLALATLLAVLVPSVDAISKNFVNTSMPELRPTFVVNFDMATVICQHSNKSDDLHLHEMSILCDGKRDCFENPAIDDESFPYCEMEKCNATCSGRGACLYNGEKPQCYCNSGFSGPMCEIVDKNGCEDQPCHWLAHCQDSVGSFKCTCFQGFHGDGFHCADIDECSLANTSCPAHSECVNLPGTYFCNCTEGYAPKGLPLERCEDIDECAQGTHNCKDGQMCQNTDGSFTCVDMCAKGYELIDGNCMDVNECSAHSPCDRRATCTNTPGGFECNCDPGLAGDGFNCKAITNCSDHENVCDRHAFCLSSLGMCICQSGYAGDGVNCHDVNECEAMENPCENQNGKRCVNIQGGYICCGEDADDERCIKEQGAYCAGGCGLHAMCVNETCKCMEGFIGDPENKCIDINECEDVNKCTGVGQWCVNMMGGHICCGPDSKEQECQKGIHVFHTTGGEVVLHHNTSQAGLISEQSGQLPSVFINENHDITCVSYCPANSECTDGICQCSKGFKGKPTVGCEDIDECLNGDPCNTVENARSWCVNVEGGFHCCDDNSNVTECLGLEITGGKGISITGAGGSASAHSSGHGSATTGSQHEGETIFSASMNETIQGGETHHQVIHEQRNFTAGEIILVKTSKGKKNEKVSEEMSKPESGETGLEITSDRSGKGKNITSDHDISLVRTTVTIPNIESVTLPTIVSTLSSDGFSTTAIPITEINVVTSGKGKDMKLAIDESGNENVSQIDASKSKNGEAGESKQSSSGELSASSGSTQTGSVGSGVTFESGSKGNINVGETVVSGGHSENRTSGGIVVTAEGSGSDEEDLSVPRSGEEGLEITGGRVKAVTDVEGSGSEHPTDSKSPSNREPSPESTSSATTEEKAGIKSEGDEVTSKPEEATIANKVTEDNDLFENGSGETTDSGEVTTPGEEKSTTESVHITEDEENSESQKTDASKPKDGEEGLEIIPAKVTTSTATPTVTTAKNDITETEGSGTSEPSGTITVRIGPVEGSSEENPDVIKSGEQGLEIVGRTTVPAKLPTVEGSGIEETTVVGVASTEEPTKTSSSTATSTIGDHESSEELLPTTEAAPGSPDSSKSASTTDEAEATTLGTTAEVGLEIVPDGPKGTKKPEIITDEGSGTESEGTDIVVATTSSTTPTKTSEIFTTESGIVSSGEGSGIEPSATDSSTGTTSSDSSTGTTESSAVASTTSGIDVGSGESSPTETPNVVSEEGSGSESSTPSVGLEIVPYPPKTTKTPEIVTDEGSGFSSETTEASKATTSELEESRESTSSESSSEKSTTGPSTTEVGLEISAAGGKTTNAPEIVTDGGSGEDSETINAATKSTTTSEELPTSTVGGSTTVPSSMETGLEIVGEGQKITQAPEVVTDVGSGEESQKTTETTITPESPSTDVTTTKKSTVSPTPEVGLEIVPGGAKTTSPTAVIEGSGEESEGNNSSQAATTSASSAGTTTPVAATEESTAVPSTTTDLGLEIGKDGMKEITTPTTATELGSGEESTTSAEVTTVSTSTPDVGLEIVPGGSKPEIVTDEGSGEETEVTDTVKTTTPSANSESSTLPDIGTSESTATSSTSTGVSTEGSTTKTHPTVVTDEGSGTIDENSGSSVGTTLSPVSSTEATEVTTEAANVHESESTSSPSESTVPSNKGTTAPGSTHGASPASLTTTSEATTVITNSASTTPVPKDGPDSEKEKTESSSGTTVVSGFASSESSTTPESVTSTVSETIETTTLNAPALKEVSQETKAPEVAEITTASTTPSVESTSVTKVQTPSKPATSPEGVSTTEEPSILDSSSTTSQPDLVLTGKPDSSSKTTEVPPVITDEEKGTDGLPSDSRSGKTTEGSSTTISGSSTTSSTANENVHSTTSSTPKTSGSVETTNEPASGSTTLESKAEETTVAVEVTGITTEESTTSSRVASTAQPDLVSTGEPTTVDPRKQERASSAIPSTSDETTQVPLEVTTLQVTVTGESATLPSKPTKDTFSLANITTPAPSDVIEPTGSSGIKCKSSDECGLDAYCERRTGACRCHPGFSGTPPEKACIDIDECATGNHKCHPTTRCHNFNGGYACFCPMGFRKKEDGTCADIDECTESAGGCCSGNATCVNEPGTYACQCKSGFTGDGYTCMPIEKHRCSEREAKAAECGNNHICMIDQTGKKDCDLCQSGFEMVGGKCVDIDECKIKNMCDVNSNCNNTEGTYACTCKDGFFGDGFMCEDIDECSSNPCHPHAQCSNSKGSFVCSCPEGWKGDGKKDCINPNESSCEDMMKTCGRVNHTACLSVRVFDGSLKSVCECESGYRLNQITNDCEDINECAENRHDCDPAKSSCVNNDGGYECECHEGYEGKGGVCVDVDECKLGTAGCHTQAMCINRAGSCGCQCRNGFTGDGTECTKMPTVTEHDGSTEEEVDGEECEPAWVRQCKLENKTCHVDDEDEPTCGSCLPGHQPRNGSCQPIYFFGKCEKNRCDKNADCINIMPDSHFCTCRDGYIGDGMKCDDVDECSVAGVCHVDAKCTNTNGSFECVCRDGFTGNGFTCTLINEGEDIVKLPGPDCHLDKGLCHPNAGCRANGTCTCNEGFEGDGIKVCLKSKTLGPNQGREPEITTTSGATEKPTAHGSITGTPTEPGKVDGDASEPIPSGKGHGTITENLTGNGKGTLKETEKENVTVQPEEKPTSKPGIIVEMPEEHAATSKAPRPIVNVTGSVSGAQRCTADDRTACHDFAICDVSEGKCRCKEGYEGDGYTGCAKATTLDCITNSNVCDSRATCNLHTRRCECDSGYIGDGIICAPHPMDCVIRKDLCSHDAICTGRRCHCMAGYTGDGIKCVSISHRSSNCTECDPNAHCETGQCACNVGYFGNGLCCVPDPRDCVHFPGECNADGYCDKEERRCKCNPGFLGNGISCFPQRSCRTSPSLCHREAVCLPNGNCLCKHGYEGDGYSCHKESFIPHRDTQVSDAPSACGNKCNAETELCFNATCECKHGYDRVNGVCADINECHFNPCHQLATCENLPGSFACSCPDGYYGDGKNCLENVKLGELSVQCEADGMTLMLPNSTELFEGRIFVRGQTENPHCSKQFSSFQKEERPYLFKVPFEHCNVRLEEKDTFAVTVVVQKHPMFITPSADAYDLKCTYPTGVREVISNVNVSDLAPSATLSDKASGPLCSLAVSNEKEEKINSVIVGDILKLTLEVQPNETYSILPKNCFAINIESGERYSLTDSAGCAIDVELFPEWTRIRPSKTQALFRTFKWPDSSMLRFQCDCSACVGDCPQIDCGRRRTAAQKMLRMRRVRHTNNGTVVIQNDDGFFTEETQMEAKEMDALRARLINSPRLAFTGLLAVKDEEDEHSALEQMEQWKSLNTASEVTAKADDTICVRTVLLSISAILALLCVGLLLATCLRYRRKSVDQTSSIFNVSKEFPDDNTSYLGF